MATISTSNGTANKATNGAAAAKPATRKTSASSKRDTSKRSSAPKRRARPNRATQYSRAIRNRVSDVPTWVSTLASVVGVGVAVGAGLFATRNQWIPKARDWADDFSAAFADDETDADNFDQTRHAGRESMRDDPGEDWDDIDEIADASFPASDPPSFSPRAS